MNKTFLISFSIICLINVSFAQVHDTLRCVDYANPLFSAADANATGYYINGILIEDNGGCHGVYTSGIHVAIIDSFDCKPVDNCYRDFGQINTIDCNHPNTTGICRTRSENYFSFSLTDSLSLMSFSHLLDSIGDGYYVLAYTWSVYAYSLIDTTFKNPFRRLGAVGINSLPDSAPYIFFCQRGYPASVVETVGNTVDTFITLTAPLNCVSLGIREQDETAMTVYPNPVTKTFTINFAQQLREDVRFVLSNTLGQTISTFKIHSGETKHEEDVSKLTNGVYFLYMEDVTKRIVIKVDKF